MHASEAATPLVAAASRTLTVSRRARRKRLQKTCHYMREELLSLRVPKLVRAPALVFGTTRAASDKCKRQSLAAAQYLCLDELLPHMHDGRTAVDASVSVGVGSPTDGEPITADVADDCSIAGMLCEMDGKIACQSGTTFGDELNAFGVLSRVRDLEGKFEPLHSALMSAASITEETHKYIEESAKASRTDREELIDRICQLVSQTRQEVEGQLFEQSQRIQRLEHSQQDDVSEVDDYWNALFASIQRPAFSIEFAAILSQPCDR